MGVSRGAWTVVVMIGISQLLLAGDCVDGVTPDCSDAAAHCGPDVDGSVLESGSRTDAPADVFDAGVDVVADADASDQ